MSAPTTHKKLSIPAGVDPDALVADIQRKDKRQNVLEACYYVLSYLVNRPLEALGRKEVDVLGGNPVNIKTLRKAVGRSATEAVNRLVEARVIERTKNYTAGARSRAYTLTELYQNQPLKEVVIESPALVKSLTSRSKAVEEQVEISGISHLLGHLTPDFITVDVEAAHYYLETWSELMRRHILNHFGTTRAKRKVEQKTKLLIGLQQRIVRMKHQLVQLEQGLPSPSRSDTNLRLHTSVVGLRSVLRNFLLFDGKPLVEVDMGAAQPLLLRTILSPDFWVEPEKSRHTPHSTTLNLTPTTHNYHVSSIYPLLHTHLLSTPALLDTIIVCTLEASSKSEYVSFASLFEKGDFYENLVLHVAAHYPTAAPEGFKDRKQVKKTMMYLMFEDFKGKKAEHIEVYRVFKTLFPSETAVLDSIKSWQPNAVALLLQRFEATLMLEHVTKSIAENDPTAYPLTVHDAVLTTEEHVEHVRQSMDAVITSVTGVKPTLRIKVLSPQKVSEQIEEGIEHDFQELKQKIRGNKYKGLVGKFLTDDSPLLLQKVPHWQGKTAATRRVWRKLLEDPAIKSLYQSIAEGMALVDASKLTEVPASPEYVVLPLISAQVQIHGTTQSSNLESWEVMPVLSSLNKRPKE